MTALDFSTLSTFATQPLPIAITALFILALGGVVGAWRKFRGGQITDWGDLIGKLEATIVRLETEKDKEAAKHVGEVRDRDVEIERLRMAERAQYDRAERAERALVAAGLDVPR